MKNINLGATALNVPTIAVGCMRMNKLENTEAVRFIIAALELGANFFDHADIYAGGACEEIFAKALKSANAPREKVLIQSKCGIRPGKAFDFSKEYILSSVDGILKRLETEYLDVLLLHRPDALMEPEEVAEAFDTLQKAGKVRHFGVSNQNPMQIQLLARYVKQPIVANQLQLSIANCGMISQGLYNNMQDDFAVQRDGNVLDFCRLNDITIQAWSPLQYGFFKGVFLDSPEFPALNKVLSEIADKYSVSNTCIAIAWLLRHPAKMQVVTGTMNVKRLKDCVKATEVNITRDEWYAIFIAAGNILP
ncbi:MAG: aldo/keto reductase [Treponema sp.]|jgi:predicted oxidoreductase|nr:aldo/keto reductase [Treponema sp.]